MIDLFEEYIQLPIIISDFVKGFEQSDEDKKKSELDKLIYGEDHQEKNKYPRYIISTLEVPYRDFSHVYDMWRPKEGSFENAMEKRFDACIVVFHNRGPFLVAMTKEKFKQHMNSFAEKFQLSEEQKLKAMEDKALELQSAIEEELSKKYPGMKLKLLQYKKPEENE